MPGSRDRLHGFKAWENLLYSLDQLIHFLSDHDNDDDGKRIFEGIQLHNICQVFKSEAGTQ